MILASYWNFSNSDKRPQTLTLKFSRAVKMDNKEEQAMAQGGTEGEERFLKMNLKDFSKIHMKNRYLGERFSRTKDSGFQSIRRGLQNLSEGAQE